MVSRYLYLLMAGGLALCACAGPRVSAEDARKGLTEQEIVQLIQEGQGDDEIIWRIGESKAAYCLYVADIARLQAEGVSNKVIDYMLDTRYWAACGPKGRPIWYRQGQLYSPPPFAPYQGAYKFGD